MAVDPTIPLPEIPVPSAIQTGPSAIPKPKLDMKPVPVEPIIAVQNGIPVPVKIPKPVRAYTTRYRLSKAHQEMSIYFYSKVSEILDGLEYETE